MNIVLSDAGLHLKFAPLTLTRPVGNLRAGILTNDERWALLCPDARISFDTEEYLTAKFYSEKNDGIRVNASVIPDESLVEVILALKDGQSLYKEDVWIASKGAQIERKALYLKSIIQLEHRWDLFQKNGLLLESDFKLVTKNRISEQLSSTNTLIGNPKNLFIEKGASIEACTINVNSGPVYIGKDTEIMEGSLIRGPFALCEGAGLKLGTKVYGPTTIGPHCRVGGEVSNVVFQAYSNKGHDGFLGNSVIGEWCNLGADTNSSNLKNNYSKVSAYSYETGDYEQTEVQFMGLIMGDHSKCGINTMFNTATVVGVSANIYGGDFPPKYIPSFSWGSSQGFERYDLLKAIQTAKIMMSRRNVDFSPGDQTILNHLYTENS